MRREYWLVQLAMVHGGMELGESSEFAKRDT